MKIKTEKNMASKYSLAFISEAILLLLIVIGGLTIPVAATTPTVSYFTGFSGFIDYGYSTSVPSIAISPSYSSTAFQEYDIKYGYSVPGNINISQTSLSGKTNIVQNNLPGNVGNFDNLFSKAIANYHVNPPTPIADPSPDFTFHNLNSVYISFT